MENTQLLPYEVWKVRQVVDELLSSTTPVGAIGALVNRSRKPTSTAFERYAGIVLRDSGAERLADLPANCTVLLTPPGEARLARLTCTTQLDEAQWALIADIEDALNRLCCIADAIEDSGQARPAGPLGISICALGAGFLPDRPGYRSAHIGLPAIGRSQLPDVGYFNEVDWRVLDHVAAIAHPVFQASVLPNMHQAFMGAHGPDGSDWDVRTRLAAILEGLELPVRFEYRFDVNVEAQAVSIACIVPPESSFPAHALDEATGLLADVGARAASARVGYVMRLACLIAAAGFGSGRNLGRVHVTGLHDQDERPVFTCSFTREGYVRKTLTAIDAGALSDPRLRFDPSAIAQLMAADYLEYAPLDETGALPAPDDGMAANRKQPNLDDRALSPDLVKLFHARRICDIDTLHYFGPGAEAVTEARVDSEESTLSAIAHLERVVHDLEAGLAPPGDDAGARPLYCANPLARAVVSLVDDDLSVSDQAQAFLRGEGDASGLSGDVSYFRAPDALFHAHMGLSDLYERLGDIRGSEAEADRCIALAPTSATAYFRKADVLAQQARYPEAANILIEGLRFAVAPRDCALLYYHLALILWNLGKKREAVAVHVYTASLSGEYAEKAQRVVANLRKRADSPVIVYASPIAASREMLRARIPVAPSDAARTLVVKAAVGLSCANAPQACAPYATALASYFRDDRVIVSTCLSLQHGLHLA